eukprot:108316-Chlamydomonas_euryale.AAC.2
MRAGSACGHCRGKRVGGVGLWGGEAGLTAECCVRAGSGFGPAGHEGCPASLSHAQTFLLLQLPA